MADYTSELIYAYLRGHLFFPILAETGQGPNPWSPQRVGSGPNPWSPQREVIGPWPWEPREIPGWPWEPREILATASLLSAISLRDAALRMPESPQKVSLERTTDARIAELIDDYCGTPPGSPWPGPSPVGYGLAAGLSFLAGTLGQGRLKDAIEEVSTQVLETTARLASLADGTAGGPPTGGGAHGPGRE